MGPQHKKLNNQASLLNSHTLLYRTPLSFKLHILYTGGTLGMQAGENGLVPAPGLARRLTALLSETSKYKNLLEAMDWSLTECTPLLDSANVVPADWERMAEQCLEHQQADAIVLVHGTDTLAYTSCALSYLLQNFDIPVIITGSQKPLEAPDSDALDNLAGAMLEARQAEPGIWVYFDQRLMPGARVVKKDAIHYSGFDTPRLLRSPENEKAVALSQQTRLREWESIQIASIHMMPAYPARHLEALLAIQPNAIILSLYGLGTLADQNPELLEALHNAQKQGVITVAISQCYIGRIDFSAYATGAQLARMGVLNGRDITLEAAYTKLMILFRLGYSANQIQKLFETNLNHEMSSQEILHD